ncbi:MAG: hypothetical protein SVC26_06300, partial [Pseudomonadota bacterium]|nr:hypothetical protein [Pseudomonadota bacterium]
MSSTTLPEDVQAQVDAHRQALQEASLPDGGSLDALITQANQQDVINQSLALSDYCATQWLQNPELLAQQLGEQHFARELSVIEIEERFLAIRDQFQARQKAQSSEEQYDTQGFDVEVKQQLRQARHYFMTGLITRFATGQDS